MTDFSFRDLLKPGDAANLALQRELRRRRETWDKPEFYYRGAGDFLLQHGRFYQGRRLPSDYEHLRGEMNACFTNALRAAHYDPGLQYCEGVYSVEGNFTPHAWCVDAAGEVVELTFTTDPEELDTVSSFRTHMKFQPPEFWGYWGVIFPELAFVDQHASTLGLPMMDRPNADREFASGKLDLTEIADYPLFKQPFDPTRKVLP